MAYQMRAYEIPIRFDGVVTVRAANRELAEAVALLGFRAQIGLERTWRARAGTRSVPPGVTFEQIEALVDNECRVDGVTVPAEEHAAIVTAGAAYNAYSIQKVGRSSVVTDIRSTILVARSHGVTFVFNVEYRAGVDLEPTLAAFKVGLERAVVDQGVLEFLASVNNEDLAIRWVEDARVL